jgi:Tfp pilus assembly protein PilO
MNKLSKDKRDKLILICLGMVGIIAVVYFFLLTDMKDEYATLGTKITSLHDKVDRSQRLLKRQAELQARADELRKQLDQEQIHMPRPAQDHVWFIKIMEDRRAKFNLDINEIRNPEAWDPGVLPKFPFKGVSFTVSLIGSYTDFGRFLADFENSYPYMRVQLMNVTTDVPQGLPGVAQPAPGDATKLRFNFRVISLIKTQT